MNKLVKVYTTKGKGDKNAVRELAKALARQMAANDFHKDKVA